eukprot:Hpha_TRINITY_DN13751_c0_g1::TRINITY_DN13751_c0_g1_i1::g.142648::m.142648
MSALSHPLPFPTSTPPPFPSVRTSVLSRPLVVGSKGARGVEGKEHRAGCGDSVRAAPPFPLPLLFVLRGVRARVVEVEGWAAIQKKSERPMGRKERQRAKELFF